MQHISFLVVTSHMCHHSQCSQCGVRPPPPGGRWHAQGAPNFTRFPLALPVVQMLNRLLDRSHLAQGKERPYPDSGTGYEVVQQLDGSGLLQGVE